MGIIRVSHKLVPFLLAFCLIAAAIHAEPSFTAVFDPDTAIVDIGGQAAINLTLWHDSKTTQTFEIYSSDVLWDMNTRDPLIVKPGQKFTTELYIRPLQVNPGLYGMPITVRLAGTNLVIEKTLMIELRVKGQVSRGYIPSIRGFVQVPKSVDPRTAIPVDVSLENQNRRPLSNLVLKFRSALINKDFTENLAALEKKSVHFDIPIDPLSLPQMDTLKLSIFASADGVTYQFDFPVVEYAVTAYGGLQEHVDSDTKYFLGRTRVITVANTGNANYAKDVSVPLSFLGWLFSKPSAKGEWSAGTYTWNVNLRPGEQTTITLRTNYWPPFIILVLAAVAIVAYYLFRSPLVVIKRAQVVAAKEGGISELKVILALRNRSSLPLKNLHLIDIVPTIAQVLRETEIGTIAPLQILTHEKKGTLVKWKLEHIEPGEERLITYHIRSRLGILGGLKLPIALARFEARPGLERSVRSNTPTLVVGTSVCK